MVARDSVRTLIDFFLEPALRVARDGVARDRWAGAYREQLELQLRDASPEDVARHVEQLHDQLETSGELRPAFRHALDDALDAIDLPVDARQPLIETMLRLPEGAAFASALVASATSVRPSRSLRETTPLVERDFVRSLAGQLVRSGAVRSGQVVPRNERFRLVRPLGRGGFGEVWLARHERIAGRHLAVKFCEAAEDVRELERELEAVQRLDHPCIVRLEDASLDDVPPWVAFEYVGGGTLTAWMRSEERSVAQGIAYARDVLEALAHAHEQGVLHRDVKPDNVLIDRETGRARLTDFGIGKILHDRGRSQTLAYPRSTTWKGTWLYTPPEVQSGEREADARADVFAFATVLWQLLALADPHAARPDDWERDLEEAGRSECAAFLREGFARHERRLPDAVAALAAFERSFGGREPGAVGGSPSQRTVSLRFLRGDLCGALRHARVAGVPEVAWLVGPGSTVAGGDPILCVSGLDVDVTGRVALPARIELRSPVSGTVRTVGAPTSEEPQSDASTLSIDAASPIDHGIVQANQQILDEVIDRLLERMQRVRRGHLVSLGLLLVLTLLWFWGLVILKSRWLLILSALLILVLVRFGARLVRAEFEVLDAVVRGMAPGRRWRFTTVEETRHASGSDVRGQG
ncbi:MAG: serine/threonine protein kinase [Planctomycetes bacterium]|nr:serine/threonine protein kinase [Planctomycetota bacterium]